MGGKDLLLLILDIANDKAVQPIQLQKSVFLVQKLLPDALNDKYGFEPYLYGPFCSAIYADMRNLALEQCVDYVPVPGRNYFNYRITDSGKRTVVAIRTSIPKATLDGISELVKWVLQQSFDSLIRAVYAKWPEWKVSSIVN